MGRRQRRRYRQQAAEAEVPAAQDHIVGAHKMIDDAEHRQHDAEYAAYLASLNDDADHMAFIDSLGEDAEDAKRPREWWEEKEKITWHQNHKPGDNWHDYLLCRCRTCTSFRKVGGIERWDETDLWQDPGQPDPWTWTDTDT